MKLQSLGYSTDLMVLAPEATVRDRGEYLVVESAGNLLHHWGNLLIFKSPPDAGDPEGWSRHFEREFAHLPEVSHITLGWQGAAGPQMAQFEKRGFQTERNAVLASSRLRSPEHFNTEVTVRRLETGSDWRQSLENQLVIGRPDPVPPRFEEFKIAQMERYRRMVEAGQGGWYGAFCGDVLVAELGIFWRSGLARFQLVGTLPEFRGRGIAGTLLFEATRLASAEASIDRFVIVADPEERAIGLYERLGFMLVEMQEGACRAPA